MPTDSARASNFTQTLSSGVGVDMVLIPAGVFTMGSPQYEPERRFNEGPQHSVAVASFFMSDGR